MGWFHRAALVAAGVALAAHAQTSGSPIAKKAMQQPSGWMLIDIGTLGGPGSYGAAVSDNGIVVGCSDVNPSGVHAFIYSNGAIQDLGTGGGAADGNACALAVNNSGMVAGRSATGELVVWKDGAVTRLGIHGNVAAMNDAGAIVGSYKDTGVERAFVFRDGRVDDLASLAAPSFATSINTTGDIVGSANGRAFLYANGAARDLGTLGGNNSVAKDINDRGQVVGFSSDAHGQPTPFLFDGSMTALPGGGYSAAIGINNRAEMIGSGEGTYGYVITEARTIALDTLPAVKSKGWRHLEPTGINQRGWIVGTAQDANGNSRAFLLVPRTP